MKKLLLPLLLFLSISAFAQNLALQPILGTGVSKKEKEKIEFLFQYQAAFYKQFGSISDTIQPKIIIFKDKKGLQNYMTFLGKKSSLGNNRLAGTFFADRRELIVARSENSDVLQSISWQVSNYFIFLTLKNIHNDSVGSHWIQPGLDSYFKYISFKKNEIRHNPPTKNAENRVKTAIETGELNLKEFIGFNKKTLYKSQRQNNHYAYSLSHYITYFLMQNHKDFFIQMIKDVENGATSFEVFEQLYPGGFAQFEKDFMNYVEN